VEALRPICREFAIEHAYLFETSARPDGPRELTLGVLLPTNEPVAGEDARRMVQIASRLGPTLRRHGVDLAFLDGDEGPILNAALDVLGTE
jgi:hypothetical protein